PPNPPAGGIGSPSVDAMFNAVVIEEDDGRARGRLGEVDEADLPEGDVTVEVGWSSVNYKDALAITGSAPIARSFPMVAGIDLAGTTADGDEVLATGYGLGER